MKLQIAPIALLLTAQAFATSAVSIDEKKLVEMANKNAAAIHGYQASQYEAAYQKADFDSNFGYELVGSSTYIKSDEQPESALSATLSPYKKFEVGVKKNTIYGTSLQATLNSLQQSSTSGSINDATKTGVTATVGIDLWKNLFGRLSKRQRENLALRSEQIKLETEINTNTFMVELRKLYWSLVANNEQLKISKQLVKTAKLQLADSKRRLRNSIADKGEVARYEAQVASRNGQIILLEYQKETLTQALKEMLPELSDKEVVLANYNLEHTVGKVLECTAFIGQKREVPWENTKYDEVVSLLNTQFSNQNKITNAIDDADVSLSYQLATSGVGNSYSNSIDEFKDDNGVGHTVGLALTIPLSKEKKRAQEVQELVDKKRYLAQREKLNAEAKAYHFQIVKSIKLLQQVIRTQQFNSAKLAESLQVLEKKYKQARVSQTDLIADQNSLLQSNLDEVSTKLTVIHTVLNYFKVFNSTPCGLNQV